MNHSRALGHATDAHGAATQLGLQGHLLINQIGGEDRVRSSKSCLQR